MEKYIFIKIHQRLLSEESGGLFAFALIVLSILMSSKKQGCQVQKKKAKIGHKQFQKDQSLKN